MNEQNLMTTAEAAKYLNVSVALLERSRWSGDPPIPFCKLGKRCVRYRKKDLEDYVISRIKNQEILAENKKEGQTMQ